MSNSFEYNFKRNAERGNLRSAHLLLIKELGKIIAKDKTSFVDLLNESGIPSNNYETYDELINKYIKNINNNKNLMLGTSLLIQMNYPKSSFDGASLSNDDVKLGYYVIRDYLNEDEEKKSNFADPVSAVAQGVGQLAGFGSKLAEGRQKQKFGALDIASKREETKQALIQSLANQRQKEADILAQKQAQQQKTNRLILITTGSIIGLAIVGTIIYKMSKK